MNVEKESGNIEHVILSEAKDLRAEPVRVPSAQILRFAQDDMGHVYRP